MVSALEATISATAGTKPSLIYKSFLVRLPMIRFLSSLRALSWTSPSDEMSRAWRSEWFRPAAMAIEEADAEAVAEGEAEADVGIVPLTLRGCHVIPKPKSKATFTVGAIAY